MRDNVTMIPATKQMHSGLPVTGKKKRKVAGYARVSTDHDEQYTSYEAQVDYYTNYIKHNPEWEYVGLYTDEGISGLNTKNRDGFRKMISDAMSGKIDLIVTKSVSRFARNTVDSLVTIRQLKEKGVECYFEKENIYTFDGKGELLLTLMSSLAQEESRSISENVTWGQRKRFSDGKLSLAYSHFLGYEKGPDDAQPLVVVEDEAKIIRRIYREFLIGKTPGAIARQLTGEGIKSPGKKDVWQANTVLRILTNEKYKGSALLQKTYTADFMTKKLKRNTGEVPQYYVEHSHEAIIPPEEWELIQFEIERRKQLGLKYSSTSVFSSRIVCGDCGAFFGAKTWNSTNKYRRTVWQCNNKYAGEAKCETPHLTDDDIKNRFLKAFNRLFDVRKQMLKDCEKVRKELTDTTEHVAELKRINSETEIIGALIKKCIEENAGGETTDQELEKQYTELTERYERLQEKADQEKNEMAKKEKKAFAIRVFMNELRERQEPLNVFDEILWVKLVDHATLRRDGTLVFHFRNGAEIET